MNLSQFFRALTEATRTRDVAALLASFEAANTTAQWLPVGRPNNRGTIEASSDPGRSLVERLTNGVDAVLEAESIRHNGLPECRSPREAGQAWLGVPMGGLSELSTKERQMLADRVSIQIMDGDGTWDQRLVLVEDRGTGLLPEEMPATILSLSENNKITKRYLVGAYGQGGSSTFACSQFTLIASRHTTSPRIGFAVVKYYEPPPDDEAKIGNYVFLTLGGAVLEIDSSDSEFPTGTRVRHFGYDLTRYNASLGPSSVYGLLNRALFDPVVPVWLTNGIHKYRRVIKGSRNALNGAVDEGDENNRGPTISHSVPIYYVDLGDLGSIGIEYWVLEPTEKNQQPIRSFVDPTKPIILTLHGQSHAELSQVLVRKDAELSYLRQRLICHVDCNRLTPGAKRSLFVSNREEARRGQAYSRIEQEVIRALTSDDELTRLNTEAREKGYQQKDQEAQKQMQSEVARLLRLQGMSVEIAGGVPGETPGNARPVAPTPPRPKAHPIEIKEPPTYIHIVWDAAKAIPFYSEQSRHLRIETDADSSYHDALDPRSSRVNVIITGEGLAVAGTTPLKGGRLRAIVRCESNAKIEATGTIRVELTRPGLPTLGDTRLFEIVAPPPSSPPKQVVSVPRIDPRPIEPDHSQWAVLDWPRDDPSFAASSSEMEDGTLVVWYSTVYPSYASEFRRFEQRDPALAKSFDTRYAIWLAVHSLLLQQDETDAEAKLAGSVQQPNEEVLQDFERMERRRIARLSAMIATREVRELKAPGIESV